MSDFQSEYKSSILFIRSNNQHAYGNKSKRTKLVFVKNKILFFELNLFYCWSFKMDLMFLVKLETISENLDQIKLKLSIITEREYTQDS